jgi:hypothetical protein
MDCPLESKNIYVTSTNRDIVRFPYGNSYTLYLTTPIKDITNVELLYASVPNTMYNVNNGTDVIGFTDKLNTVDNVVLTTVPVGFYGSTTLASAIFNATQYYSNVSVSYLSGEGKFLFTRPTSFTMNVMTQELASLLGLDFPCQINATNSVGTPYENNLTYKGLWYVKSKYVIDMNAYDGVFLDIQELRTNYNECTPKGTPFDTTNNNTANRSFGMIPMDVSSSSIKRFKKSTEYDLDIRYPYPIQKLDRLTVNWVDKNGQLLSFNGAEDNSIILRFHTLRKNLC